VITDNKSSLDNMSPSQIRVVLEHLLMTMDFEQRTKFMETFPGLYKMIYPGELVLKGRPLTEEEYKVIYPEVKI
jgi:hypothetical protein